MNVRQWYDTTSTKHGLGLTDAEKAKRNAERARVLAKAGTSISTIRIALCRQAKGKRGIGLDLLDRLVEATKDEKHKILRRHELPDN